MKTVETINTEAQLTRAEAVLRILNTKGRFFTVTFVKKDNTKRKMTARLRVTKYLTGGGRKYNPSLKGLITVFDVAKQNYRNINVNTVLELATDGQKYKVK